MALANPRRAAGVWGGVSRDARVSWAEMSEDGEEGDDDAREVDEDGFQEVSHKRKKRKKAKGSGKAGTGAVKPKAKRPPSGEVVVHSSTSTLPMSVDLVGESGGASVDQATITYSSATTYSVGNDASRR